ncbi:MAG: hypothetical protein V1872_14950 [bacterium]
MDDNKSINELTKYIESIKDTIATTNELISNLISDNRDMEYKQAKKEDVDVNEIEGDNMPEIKLEDKIDENKLLTEQPQKEENKKCLDNNNKFVKLKNKILFFFILALISFIALIYISFNNTPKRSYIDNDHKYIVDVAQEKGRGLAEKGENLASKDNVVINNKPNLSLYYDDDDNKQEGQGIESDQTIFKNSNSVQNVEVIPIIPKIEVKESGINESQNTNHELQVSSDQVSSDEPNTPQLNETNNINKDTSKSENINFPLLPNNQEQRIRCEERAFLKQPCSIEVGRERRCILEEGLRFYSNKRFDRAFNSLRLYLRQNPMDNEAKETLEKAESLTKDAISLYKKAKAKENEGDHHEALRFYQDSYKIYPQLYDTWERIQRLKGMMNDEN